jgi:hypothetical protein
LTKHGDFEALAASVDAAAPRPSRAKGGRPPYPTVLMVKIPVLQQLYNLADDALEYQLLDRRSFLQFLDLTESSSIPDAKTIWLFRDRLAQAGVGTRVTPHYSNRSLIAATPAAMSMPIVATPPPNSIRRSGCRPLLSAPDLASSYSAWAMPSCGWRARSTWPR